MHINMEEILRTEEEYRKALQRFLAILETEQSNYDALELFEIMKMLETYEQENCM